MDTVTLALNKARELIVYTQLARTISSREKSGKAVAEIVEKMGYVQIDSINVINRAHHHTLWARYPQYKNDDIYRAQAQDKSVFEYWGHAMSYLPMSDYRYYLPYKNYFNDPYGKWEKDRHEKYGHLMQPALERIQKEGPMATRDFVSESQPHKGTWWDWRPIKVALELLFWQGKIMVAERKNFQKIFDLTERVLPDGVDATRPNDEELGRFLVKRALQAYGLANQKEIVDHLRVTGKNVILHALKQMIVDGEVLVLNIPELTKNGDYYILPETLQHEAKVPMLNDRVFILSPFDNFCIQRDRLKTIFNFDYALECYLKPEQRSFGYFALPLFWKDRFIGRIDAKADRSHKTLIVHHLKMEDGFQPDEQCLAAVLQALKSFMIFQGCRQMQISQVTPASLSDVFLKQD